MNGRFRAVRQVLAATLVMLSACALEHPISFFDGSASADRLVSDGVVDDLVDAATKPDASFYDADSAMNDAVDAAADDAIDAAADDAIDAAADDAIDAAADDAVDAAADDAVDAPEMPDVVDAPATPDVVDAPATPDVVDAPATPDVVDAPATPDVVDAPATTDVPSVVYSISPTDTNVTDRQGSNNGTDRSFRCNSGEVLVGLRVRAGSYVHGFASRCAALRSNGTLGATRETGYEGSDVFGSFSVNDCPAGSVVVGLTGGAGAVVDRVAVQCAPLASWIPARMGVSTLTSRGGGGGSAFTAQCPAGFVGLGVEFDTLLYNLSGVCASRLRLACVRVSRQP